METVHTKRLDSIKKGALYEEIVNEAGGIPSSSRESCATTLVEISTAPFGIRNDWDLHKSSSFYPCVSTVAMSILLPGRGSSTS